MKADEPLAGPVIRSAWQPDPAGQAGPADVGTLALAALPISPFRARRYTRSFLDSCPGISADVTGTAELIVSELVANAVVASGSVPGDTGALVIRVCLITDGNVLTVEVWDQAPGVPLLLEGDGFAENGRGLRIIDTLTDGAWGCQPAIGQPGKCVWAGIRLRDEPIRQFLS